jgi:hypothetical protein
MRSSSHSPSPHGLSVHADPVKKGLPASVEHGGSYRRSYRHRGAVLSRIVKPNFAEYPFQRLSGNSLCGSNGAFLVGRSAQNSAISPRSTISRDPIVEHIRSFQTVSPRTPLNKGKKEQTQLKPDETA